MTKEDLPDLSERQKEIVDMLPASTRTIADALGIKTTTVQNHRNNIKEKGIDLKYDEDSRNWYIADEREADIRRVSTQAKSARTRKVNELIEAEESTLLRHLRATEPLEAEPPSGDGDGEAFVAALGDLHFGDVVESSHGDVLYDIDSARNSVERFGKKCREIRQLEGEYTHFDEAHLVLIGDIATGTHVYDGQVHDIEGYLARQVTESSEALVNLILELSEEFDRVSVHAVLGNHGKDRAAAARGSNTDLICYRWVQHALRRERPPGVEMEISESSHDLDFRVKNKTVHIRHGNQTQEHVDSTARSEADWRGIWANSGTTDDPGFDLAVRGHHHVPAVKWLLNAYPVVTVPSPKPGGEFAEMIGSPDVSNRRHLGWTFGVSKDRRMTFKRLVDDR